MGNAQHQLVGAVLDGRDAAFRAAERLQREGGAPRGMLTAVWRGDQYVVESHAPQRIGRGLIVWGLSSAVLGAIVAALLLLLWFPDSAAAGAMVWGAIIGSGLGLVLGGYWGIARHEKELWNERDWGDIRLGPNEVLIALEVRDEMRRQVVDILEESGGRAVKPVHPER